MPLTINDFEKAISSWEVRGMTSEEFEDLRDLFSQYLAQGQEKEAWGIIDAILCFRQVTDMKDFARRANRYGEMKIPMHYLDGQYKKKEMPFFECLYYLSPDFSLHLDSLLKNMMSLSSYPLAPGQDAVAMESAIMDVNQNLLLLNGPDLTPKEIQTLIENRMSCLVNYLKDTSEKNFTRSYQWELTGSDPHNGGQQTLLFKAAGPSSGKNVVFKPRHMLAERMLFGRTSPTTSMDTIFQYINSYLTESLPQLAVMDVSYREGDPYGTETLVQKKDEYTPEQAKNYFKQMGMLMYVCTLYGCIDLHQDNVMPTENGPLILDGECSYLFYIMESKTLSLKSCQLIDAINDECNVFNEKAVSYFQVTGAYTDQMAQDALWEGFYQIRQLSEPKMEELKNLFVDILKQRPLVRILPFSTLDLKEFVIDAALDMDTVVNDIMQTLTSKKDLYHIHWSKDDQVKTVLKNGLKNGDIPLFQLHPDVNASGFFLINGSPVGWLKAYTEEDIRSIFQRVADYLKTVKKEDMPEIKRFGT